MERLEIVGAPFMGALEMENMVGIYDKRVPTRGTPTHKYNRKSLRLPHYDYAKAGYYFITITAQNREHLFGEIVGGKMVLGVAGEMVNELWYDIPNDFNHVILHDFVIMPNHIHGIIEIVGAPLVGALGTVGDLKRNDENIINGRPIEGNHKGLPLRQNIGDIVGAFKSKTTNKYIQMVKNNTLPPFHKRIWQRNFYEHVVRDEKDYARIAEYIQNNETTWELDILNKS